MKRIPTIRVLWWTNRDQMTGLPKDERHDQSGLLIEQLRRMGFVRVLAEQEHTEGPNIFLCSILEFQAPKGTDPEGWCQANAARMSSFGINAVVAPIWDNIENLREWSEHRNAIHPYIDIRAPQKN